MIRTVAERLFSVQPERAEVKTPPPSGTRGGLEGQSCRAQP